MSNSFDIQKKTNKKTKYSAYLTPRCYIREAKKHEDKIFLKDLLHDVEYKKKINRDGEIISF